MSQDLVTRLLTIAAVGGAVAINGVIIGLILIAVIHDGTTGSQIAAAFEASLSTLISVTGAILSSMFTGKLVHSVALSQTQQIQQLPLPTEKPPVQNGN